MHIILSLPNISEYNKKIIADKYNSIIFKSKKDLDIYLVGGYVRDFLLGRKSLDRDYAICGEFRNFIKKIASKTDGKIVRIGKMDLHRIVFKNGLTFDFMPVDKNIEHDVFTRDFSINSLAWSPERGFIDLHDGIKDLSKKIIRSLRIANLKSDPVRIIRAYRLADELSFRIETKTRNALKVLCRLIKEAKSERITLEFFRILNSKNPQRILKMMLEDGILRQILLFLYNEIDSKFKVINSINKKLNKLPLRYKVKLNDVFSQNLTYRGLIRLEILIMNSPRNHRLNLSSRILKKVSALEKAERLIHSRKPLKKEDLYDIFSIAGSASLDCLIIHNLTKYINEMERFFKIMKKGFLSAGEIEKISGLEEGKELGNTIKILKKAQFTNKIKTKKEAVKFLKRI
jgi:tRNA nucleotidyltransferase/poly(A) polymerase